MTPDEVARLEPGIYRLIFVDTGHTEITRSQLGIVWPLNNGNYPARAYATTRSSGSTDWAAVESVERLAVCETPARCQIRREMLERTKHDAIALARSMSADAAVIARDSFLAGDDGGALAIVSHELGLVQLASPRPVWRDLRVGDPVVIVGYGRIIDRSTGHGTCYGVSLFQEGLGYGNPGGTNPRVVWVEADEIRYSLPPEHILGRVGAGDRKSLDGVARDRPTAAPLTSSPFAYWDSLTDEERLLHIKRSCRMCGSIDGCSCVDVAPYSKDPRY